MLKKMREREKEREKKERDVFYYEILRLGFISSAFLYRCTIFKIVFI